MNLRSLWRSTKTPFDEIIPAEDVDVAVEITSYWHINSVWSLRLSQADRISKSLVDYKLTSISKATCLMRIANCSERISLVIMRRWKLSNSLINSRQSFRLHLHHTCWRVLHWCTLFFLIVWFKSAKIMQTRRRCRNFSVALILFWGVKLYSWLYGCFFKSLVAKVGLQVSSQRFSLSHISRWCRYQRWLTRIMLNHSSRHLLTDCCESWHFGNLI